MNRLTKQISLVLISSSLVLHGCHQEPVEEEKKEDDKTGTTGTTGHTSGHRHSWWPHFFSGGGWTSGRTGSGVSTRSGISSSSGTRSSSGARSGVGGSSRGGFGSSAHGASS